MPEEQETGNPLGFSGPRWPGQTEVAGEQLTPMGTFKEVQCLRRGSFNENYCVPAVCQEVLGAA